MKTKLLSYFFGAFFLLLNFQVSAAGKNVSNANLVSTQRQEQKIAAGHFQHSVCVEENIVNFINQEITPDLSSFFGYFRNKATLFSFQADLALSAKTYFIPDKKERILQLIFPFHYFF